MRADAMAEKGSETKAATPSAENTFVKPSAAAPVHLTEDPDEPGLGWRGIFRRGSHSGRVEYPLQERKAPVPRRTSLTPEMEIPTSLNRRGSVESVDLTESPGTSPTSRGSILDTFMGQRLGGLGKTRILDDLYEDFTPPVNQPRRSSMTDAMQWLFKPMDTKTQLKSRDFNAFVPTST